MRLFQFAEQVHAWGTGREFALPCKVEYLLNVLKLSVQMRMKAKVMVEINAESWVKGKRWSCPSPFLREPAYIKLHIRVYGTNLSRDIVEDGGDRGGATTYTSFPSKIVSNVAA